MSATVYGFTDTDGTWLYIGCTEKLPHRLSGHRRKPWWPEVARIHVLACGIPRRGALRIERHLIEQREPVHNVFFTRRWRLAMTGTAAIRTPPLTDAEQAALAHPRLERLEAKVLAALLGPLDIPVPRRTAYRGDTQ